MIGGVNGIIFKKGKDTLLVNVSGVFYKIYCSKQTLDQAIIGDVRFFYIETSVGDDFIKLYGFSSFSEQEWFLTLSSVQGVGAKAAFAILSVASLEDISNAVLFKDPSVFLRAQGVGPKLASRIANELSGKKNLPPVYDDEAEIIIDMPTEKKEIIAGMAESTIPPFPASVEKKVPKKKAVSAKQKKQKIIEGACSALVNLGYQKMDAMRAILEASEGEEDLSEGEIIHAALQYIGKMKEMA